MASIRKEEARRAVLSDLELEFHQILREHDRSRKILAGFIGVIAVVLLLIDLRPKMRHDDGLHPGLGRHLTDVFRRDVLFVHSLASGAARKFL